jgi:hypothetical protein
MATKQTKVQKGALVKPIRLAAATVALAFAGLGATAAPAGASQPVGGCPDSFQVISLKKLAPLLGLTLAQVEAIPAIDNNGDGFTCFRQAASGNFHGTDNNL